MRAGMREWMQAWEHCSVSPAAKPQARSDCEAIIPLGIHSEVVSILAGIVLSNSQEARV
jgi:hypothetical protein